MNQVYKISDRDKTTLRKRLREGSILENGALGIEDAIDIFEKWYATHMSARKRFQINK